MLFIVGLQVCMHDGMKYCVSRCAVFGDLHLLDKVFKALLATNKHHGRKASFPDMLNIKQTKPGQKFLYFCDNRKWRCQIFVSDGKVIV